MFRNANIRINTQFKHMNGVGFLVCRDLASVCNENLLCYSLQERCVCLNMLRFGFSLK